MQRTTKGAIAAAAAAVLLLGGAGTMANWTDAVTNPGSSIRTGTISLGVPNCGAGWQYVAADGGGAASILVPGDEVYVTCKVPISITGDHMEADITPTIPAIGMNSTTGLDVNVLSLFDLQVDTQVCTSGGASCQAAVDTTWDAPTSGSAPNAGSSTGVGAVDAGTVGTAYDGGYVAITIDATLPLGILNSVTCALSTSLCSSGQQITTQGVSALLDDLTVTATQSNTETSA